MKLIRQMSASFRWFSVEAVTENVTRFSTVYTDDRIKFRSVSLLSSMKVIVIVVSVSSAISNFVSRSPNLLKSTIPVRWSAVRITSVLSVSTRAVSSIISDIVVQFCLLFSHLFLVFHKIVLCFNYRIDCCE